MRCAGCGAVKAAKYLSEVLPPFGWRGYPVPICDICDNTEDRYNAVVAAGKREVWQVDETPHPVAAGDLVYIESFAGLIPGKLAQVRADSHGWCAVVRVTAQRPGFGVGERVTIPVNRVVRRRSVRIRSGRFRVINNWHVITDGKRVDVFAGGAHVA